MPASISKRHPVTFRETLLEHAHRLHKSQRQVKLLRYCLSSKIQNLEPHPEIPWEIRNFTVEQLEAALRIERESSTDNQVIFAYKKRPQVEV